MGETTRQHNGGVLLWRSSLYAQWPARLVGTLPLPILPESC